MSLRYHLNKYGEIYGDGMNSFQNESHSGIMWIAPKEQELHSTNLPHQTTQQLILKATDLFGKKTEPAEENKT